MACASSDPVLCLHAAPDLDLAVQVVRPVVQAAETMLRDTTRGGASIRMPTRIHSLYVAAIYCSCLHGVSMHHAA